MEKLRIVVVSLLIGFHLVACDQKSDEIMCTMEFRIISLEVIGAQLSAYYTIREATNDTIHLQAESLDFFNSYPVLTDAEFVLFETNTLENFRFIGFVDDVKLIEEVYSIGADQCHIFLAEGKTKIDLSE